MKSYADTWMGRLRADPLPWLLEEDTPAVRHIALRSLLNRPEDDPEVQSALRAAMRTDPIAGILAAQHPDGYWVKPGAGYSPKYTATVWQVSFLDQLGADPGDRRVQAACEYVLSHTQAKSGGFGAMGSKDAETVPPPSRVIHCLNGNLLRALIGFGRLGDERVQRAIEWEARSITGEGFGDLYGYYRSATSGPGFCCAANGQLPCAWGAVKALLALARVPSEERKPYVQRAVEQAAGFLLSRDPSVADYPAGWEDGEHKLMAGYKGSLTGADSAGVRRKPSASWFKLGFPSGYVTDVLQNLEALCEAGYAGDPRLRPAVEWVLSKQDAQGRWKNQYAYNGKTWVDFERQGAPSKWVTLRACRVASAVLSAGELVTASRK